MLNLSKMSRRDRPTLAAALVVTLAVCAGCKRSPSGPTEVALPPVSDTSTFPQLVCASPTSGQTGPTYYVAISEPGANNESCDGLSPSNRGSGHCPFKDFASSKTFALLRNVSGVRVEVRAGVYTFVDEGLTVNGTGNSESSRVVLTAYQNEGVVFDGRNTLREVIRVGGRFTAVERVTIRNSGGYNMQVGGGSDHLVQCNRFLANAASDSLKGTDGATQTIVRGNDFSEWDSQAIDLAPVRDWTIIGNEFHDPKSASANAVGAKFGTRGVLITGNRFRNTRGLTFGGTSTSHGDDFEAYDLVAEHNIFENITGQVVKFYSCSNCIFRDNDAKTVGGGFVLGGDQMEGPSGCAGGCRPTQGATILRNRLTDLRGNPSNTFWGLFRKEAVGLSAAGNLYCTPADQNPRFRVDNQDLFSLADWTLAIGTDATSTVARSDQGICNAW
jgi:hypothetical protein